MMFIVCFRFSPCFFLCTTYFNILHQLSSLSSLSEIFHESGGIKSRRDDVNYKDHEETLRNMEQNRAVYGLRDKTSTLMAITTTMTQVYWRRQIC